MATEVKYEVPATIVEYLANGDLYPCADGATILGDKIDNGADGENEMLMALELVIGTQGSARDAGGYVAVYLLPSVDDTTFSYGDDTPLIDPGTLLCIFSLDAATTARTVTRVNLPIPPLDFKLLVENQTGQALGATGNSLSYRLYSYESQ